LADRAEYTSGTPAPMSCPGTPTKLAASIRISYDLWKDADPDIPILKEAKAEYAKLQPGPS